MRKISILAIIGLCSTLFTSDTFSETSNVQCKKARDRANKVMTSLLPGPPEVPSSASNSDARDAGTHDCGCRAAGRIEKGIVDVVGGVWQLATFWCPDSECADVPCDSCKTRSDNICR
jgi:hypothetical protein